MSDTKRLSDFIGKEVQICFDNGKTVVGVLKRISSNYKLYTSDNDYLIAKNYVELLHKDGRITLRADKGGTK